MFLRARAGAAGSANTALPSSTSTGHCHYGIPLCVLVKDVEAIRKRGKHPHCELGNGECVTACDSSRVPGTVVGTWRWIKQSSSSYSLRLSIIYNEVRETLYYDVSVHQTKTNLEDRTNCYPVLKMRLWVKWFCQAFLSCDSLRIGTELRGKEHSSNNSIYYLWSTCYFPATVLNSVYIIANFQ